MNRWFRFYAEAMRNPKIIRLSDKDFRLWVRLLAVAAENGGSIPCLDDLKHMLSMRLDHLSSGVDRLISGGLIDVLDGGYEPHNWNKFQYKSDTSTERVTKHRKKRNVSETPPDTEADTEAETDTPLDKSNGGIDPEKAMFDAGVSLLRKQGKSEAAARTLLGKWKRDHGPGEVIEMLGTAQRLAVVDIPSWAEGRWRAGAKAEAVIPI